MCLLSHLSSFIHLVPDSRRRTRLLQIRLNQQWDRCHMTEDVPVSWDDNCYRDLEWWLEEHNLLQGQPLQIALPDLFLYTDVSSEGWGAYLLQDSVSGTWNCQERMLHINQLKLRAIRLGLLHFAEVLKNSTVAVFSDSTTALAYVNKEGVWTLPFSTGRPGRYWISQSHSVNIVAQFVRGSDNVVADCLSRRHQIIPTEWTLHSDVC